MASDKCIKHQKIQESLGNPIKVFGEENGKLKHLAYEDEDGLSGLRFQFHLQGSRQRGLAEVDAREVNTTFHIKCNFNISPYNFFRILVMEN